MRKRVLFIANSLDNAYKFQQVLMEIDVEVSAGTTAQIKKLLTPGSNPDLVIFESRSSAQSYMPEIASLAENQGCALLVIVDEESVRELRLPTLVASDFVMNSAGKPECAARVMRLLGTLTPSVAEDTIYVDNMTLNLATYQVTIGGMPIDLTYLEYALLVYFVQHPSHTFTRDALLQNVWGFDYYGGSRTVDVHVRRIRAKLGPKLAQHLETVRGVGYLWNPSTNSRKV